MIKKILICTLFISVLSNPVFAKTKMEKLQRNADIYFKITDTLDLSLRQQRKAFDVKLEESFHLAPIIEDIKLKEEKLNNNNLTPHERKELQNQLDLKKAVASQKKRYYIARYRSILSEEQNHRLDELIFDLANGYIKL